MHKKEIFLEIDANLHQPIQSMEADSNSRAIRFYLTSNYAPLNLKDKKVIFKAVKPDSTDIVNDCEIIDVEKGIVETKVTKQLNAVPGRVNCQLSIIGVNDYVLKTKKFGILVDSKLTESGIISSREYKTLENALSEVHEINKNFEQVNAKINEVATKGTTVEVIEEVTKEEIERQIADGTIAHLMIEDGSVTPEKTSFYDEIATQKNLLKNAEFDYMGNNQNTVKKAIDSSIDWVLGEVNTAHHEGQHITATDTIEGHAKSAILKGNTLVNIFDVTLPSEIRNNHDITISYHVGANETYTFIVEAESTSEKYQGGFITANGLGNGWNGSINNGFSKFTVTTSEATNKVRFSALGASNTVQIKKCMIIKGDYINQDIPFFTGMQSVQMPVLTTTGKNLFNIEHFANIENWDSPNGSEQPYFSYKLNLKPNTKYTFSRKDLLKGENTYLALTTKQGVWDSAGGLVHPNEVHNKTELTVETNDTGVLYLNLYKANTELVNTVNCLTEAQVEESSVATTYEPYKTNILSTPSDLELRGIGNVQDTLNCLTGEVTQRIGEIVLDGSDDESWATYTNNREKTVQFRFDMKSTAKGQSDYTKIISSHLPSVDIINNNDIEGVSIYSNGNIYISLLRTKAETLSGLKSYLQSNPITVQYELATESIKTVDLSDNHVYSYKDVTHYDCSSAEGSLVPALSIDVPTNLPAVVTRQRATIQELEKENVALKNEIEETANSSVNGDLELMSSQFELDFRLFEIEMNLDMPMMATMRGVKGMAMTVYQQAKTLILAGKYEREDMEYKLNRYKAAGRITVEEYEELIALMDARELVD